MDAMILAAGRGERLRPYTDECPKPLLEVQGEALIIRHIKALSRAGINHIVINTCWLGENIQDSLKDGRQFGVRISYSHEVEALETAGGIYQALNLLDEQFIVVNGDILTSYSYENLFSIKTEAHLVLVENPTHNQSGDFSIDTLGFLSNTPSLTFTGISCFKKSFFDDLHAGRRALAPYLRSAADQQKVTAELFDGVWSDIGTLQRWRDAEFLDLSL